MRKVAKRSGEKKAENLYHLSYYRKFVQIASFSLTHPSGARSSEGAAKLQAPTSKSHRRSRYLNSSLITHISSLRQINRNWLLTTCSLKDNFQLSIVNCQFGITGHCQRAITVWCCKKRLFRGGRGVWCIWY